MVAGWTAFDAFIRDRLPDLQHRRVDLAFDFFDGSMTYEHVEESREEGGFDPVRGARPMRNRFGYPEAGRTFEVGNRKTADRFHRCYEKGFEQGRHPWGESFDKRLWFRLECEFKPANGPIPLDIVSAREAFFAGAAPLYAQVLAGVVGRRGVRDPLAEIGAEIAEAVRHSAGPALAVLRDIYGTDAALLDALVSGAVKSPRLVEAGARILTREDMARFGV
jgi:DNA relaxase NicK